MPKAPAKKASPAQELAQAPQQQQQSEVRIILNHASGSTGLNEAMGFIQEAYNANLFWPKVFKTYDKLRRSMPEMVMVRTAFAAWAKNVSPVVDLPSGATDDDKRYKDFLESDFENMDGGFVKFLDTCVNQVPFLGWGWWDVQHSIRDPNWVVPVKGDEWESEADDGFIGLRRLSWRSPSTFNGWIKDNDQVKGFYQQAYPNPPIPLMSESSLHITHGDANNPEGLSPLESVWRVERLQYGYQVIHGIGSEHAAGYLNVNKTTSGGLSTLDKQVAKAAARAIMTGQEGNYALWPYGLEGEIKDIPFSAASSLLDIIKYYSIVALAIYAQQWIALNTFTNTGALASQTESTSTGIFTFNSMLDGIASQYDQQIGKRLWNINQYNFPDMTKRPNIRFTHVKNNPSMQEIGNFLRAVDGIVPFGGEDDWTAVRQQTEWMPEETPEDAIAMFEKRKSLADNLNKMQNNFKSQDDNQDNDQENDQGPTPDQVAQASMASYFIRESLRRTSRNIK